jgi:WD40 repeat protein
MKAFRIFREPLIFLMWILTMALGLGSWTWSSIVALPVVSDIPDVSESPGKIVSETRDKPEVYVQTGHSKSMVVTAAALSPDERHVVTGGWGGKMIVWDRESGRELLTIKAPGDPETLAVSPDGRFVLSGGHTIIHGYSDIITEEYEALILWDLKTGKKLREFKAHEKEVASAVFSPDGKYIVSGGKDKVVILWEVATGRVVKKFSDHPAEIQSVSFSSDGKKLFVGTVSPSRSFNEVLHIWDIESGQKDSSFNPRLYKVEAVAFSADGKFVAVASSFTIEVYEVKSGNQIFSTYRPFKEVLVMALSPDGGQLLAGLPNRMIWWNTRSGLRIKKYLTGLSQSTNSLAFSPDGRYALVAGFNAPTQLYDLRLMKEVQYYGRPSIRSSDVVVSEDGKKLVTGLWESTARFWDLQTGRSLLLVPDYKLNTFGTNPKYLTRGIGALELTKDGNRLYGKGRNSSFRLWDAHTGKVLKMFREDFLALSADERYFLSKSHNTARLWNLKAEKKIREFKVSEKSISSGTFSPDGKLAVITGYDKSMTVWNLETGKKIKSLVGHEEFVLDVVFTGDGKRLLSAGSDSTLKLWNLSTGTVLLNFVGHGTEWLKSGVNSVALSRDEKFVVSGGGDGKVILWDMKTGKKLKTFSGHEGSAGTVAFSRDGKKVFSGGFHGMILVWDVETGKELLQMISFRGGGWASITPEGYYVADFEGEKRLNVRVGGKVYYVVDHKGEKSLNTRVGDKVYGIESFRNRFYKPEKVKRALASSFK